MKKRGLGRSLNAILSPSITQENLISHDDSLAEKNILRFIPITQLMRGEYQPRRDMDEEAIDELALSIKSQGVLQPIIVRKKGEKFEIIAGERRWRASQKANLQEVPVIIKDIADDAAMAIGLIENIQRENLNTMDEALGLQRLLKEFSLTHQEIADAVGRSRASVSNLLRLLNLPEVVQKYLQSGDLEMGHARALLALPETQQLAAAKHIIEKAFSVRETENYMRQLQNLTGKQIKVAAPLAYSDEIAQLQKQLSSTLRSKVLIQQNAAGKGKLILHYTSENTLKKLMTILTPGLSA